MLLFWGFLLVIEITKTSFKSSYRAAVKFDYFQLAIIALAVIISIIFLGLFSINPYQFSLLALEDRIIENASACLCFTATVILLISLFELVRFHKNHSHPLSLIFLTCLSIILFVIGMEEISWFQRAFQIATPPLFLNNAQVETNLHNFATDTFEYIYYLGAFALFGVIPLIKRNFQKYQWYSSIDPVLPDNLSFHISAIAAAYNYDMWNLPLIQVAFGITLFGLFFYAVDTSHPIAKGLQIILIVIVIVSQVTFIMKGNTLLRQWDITEYKEFFIALTMLAFAFEVLGKIRKCDRYPL